MVTVSGAAASYTFRWQVIVYRRLREAGSTGLQHGTTGQDFLAQGLDQAIHTDIRARFKTDQDQEYDRNTQDR